MDRTFNPTSRSLRVVFALAAVLAMLATAGAIEGLIGHYEVESQLASAKPTEVAKAESVAPRNAAAGVR